ncbi:thiamine pyrophosphate-binding protein [Kitasatospora acidiphila]|uniref:Thiamine pyrophosphate-binding protein n=1 Tax=Kitasatospora acidiphila TaxID=2567942 RepID=A0A540W794_9ACTN|nr:thiamine pyrophosphate-binding protein [Kitasatospora acidiphila]TQF04891.1 thiamine pyrophosphate-binding protein [Kitasatospora acidiphila]
MAGSRPARVAIHEQFRADGVQYMFGNPGTVEQGFLDELREFPDLQYVLALQEAVVVGIADGYARATRKPALLQLHSGVGLGNGIGMLYQAMRGHAPLVCIVGESGLAYDSMDAQMAADLVGMAKPVTKWATRVVDPQSTLRVLRRAFKVAGTPPYGPVLVVLPADVMDQETTEDAVPTSYLTTTSVPDAASVEQAAALLAPARHPLILAGDGVHFSGAQGELAEFAEAWGATVWGADWAEVNLPASHPLFGGQLGHMFGEASAKVINPADGVLIVGTYTLNEVYPLLDGVFAPDAKVVHVDLDSGAIAKNFPVDLGLLADPKATLPRLTEALRRRQTGEQKADAAGRLTNATQQRKIAELEKAALDIAGVGHDPLCAELFGWELAKHLPTDAVLFDEALTSSPGLFRHLPADVPGQWHQTRGGSLGVGIPGAVGAKLAHPEREVIGFTGDGGSMYTVQALWTAARYGIAAKFVICNNGRYKLLDLNIEEYWKTVHVEHHEFPGPFDLDHPAIDFVKLAESLAVPAVRVEKPEQVAPAITRMLAHNGPFLIDLVIGRTA